MRTRNRPTPNKPPKVRVLVVLGSTPELLRMAPVVAVLRGMPDHFEVEVVAPALGAQLSAEADAVGTRIDVWLALGADGDATARVGAAMDRTPGRKPHVVLVGGDTDLVLATALACLQRQIELAHVGAGLRSDARTTTGPLERRRRAITALASLHFPATDIGRARLLAEGVDGASIAVTGNPIVEALEPLAATADPEASPKTRVVTVLADESPIGGLPRWIDEARQMALDTRSEVLLLTPERTGTFDSDGTLAWGPAADLPGRARWLLHARIVVTDCPDAEETCVALGSPVVVARARTELVEALTASVSEVVGTDLVRAFARARAELRSPRLRKGPRPLGDGKASLRVALALTAFAARLISDEQARRAA